jgi:hypothetical protein
MRLNDRSCWWLVGVMLVLAPASSLTSGCRDASRSDVAGRGTLRLPLGAQGTSGAMYRLRNAELSVSGPFESVLYSEDHLSAQSIVFDLPAGSYDMELSGAWWLERQTANGFVPVAATLLSQNPDSFEILSGMVSVLTLSFRVDGDVVQIGPGSVVVQIDVDDSGSGGFGGQGPDAGAGGVDPVGEGGTAGQDEPGEGGEAGGPDTCGDGVLDEDEACDDGADGDPCDGCLDNCETHPIPPPGPPVVPSVIEEDTVWCEGQSPVSITENTALMPGAGLYIGPGVVVRFSDSVGLQIRGEMRAIGTANAPVVFSSASPTPTRNSWGGIQIVSGDGGRALFRHALVEYSQGGVSNTCCGRFGSVEDTTFQHNEEALGVQSGWEGRELRRLTFVDNGQALYWGTGWVVHSSIFRGNDYVGGVDSAFDSTIVDNGHGISFYGTLERCLVADNQDEQIDARIVIDSTIVRNGGGLYQTEVALRNTLCENGAYDFANGSVNPTDANSNWWCSTEPTFISGRIIDFFDDFNLGPVAFEPFLTSPSPAAPADPGPP